MFQKFKLKFNKKGYLQIDIAFGLFIFLILFIFVYNYYAHYKNDVIQNNEILILDNDAKNICFLLVNSPGNPIDWESDLNNTNFFGLKEVGVMELDSNKINSFTNFTYFTILDKLNISANFAIKIDGISTNNNYLNFGVFADDIYPIYSNYECFANYNSEVVKVYVEVWK